MIGPFEAQCARLETRVSAASNAALSVSVPSPTAQETALGCSLFRPGPTAAATQIFTVVVREASHLKRPECSTRRQCSTRIREFRE
jgi:hypothetical protein